MGLNVKRLRYHVPGCSRRIVSYENRSWWMSLTILCLSLWVWPKQWSRLVLLKSALPVLSLFLIQRAGVNEGRVRKSYCRKAGRKWIQEQSHLENYFCVVSQRTAMKEGANITCSQQGQWWKGNSFPLLQIICLCKPELAKMYRTLAMHQGNTLQRKGKEGRER